MKLDRFPVRVISLLLCLMVTFGAAQAQTPIEITTQMFPPGWAFMERTLLEENARFMETFVDKYVNPATGHLECVARWGIWDGPDDAMENFNGWPMVYAMGGPKSTLDLVNFVWNGHIDQYSKALYTDGRGNQMPMFYREFITHIDWEHSGEGYAAFDLFPLCDPVDWRTQQRTVRFANFYTGRDTTTHNYDPKYKIIRSVLNGSMGPLMTAEDTDVVPFEGDWQGHGYGSDSFISGWKRPKGDIPFNMCTTALATNAYLITGDEHYKNWVLEYVGAWAERAKANGGIIPSNVGLNGIVGEDWDGKWYGGTMGWDFEFGGWYIIGRGTRIGCDNAYLISGGDSRFAELIRNQGDILLKNGKKTPNGKGIITPDRYGDDGWYQYTKTDYLASTFSDLYLLTLEDQDLKRLKEINVPGWIQFLLGGNPDYPAMALQSDFERLRRNVEGIRMDKSTPDTRFSDTSQRFSNAGITSLINLTMGGHLPSTSGGLLFCQVRYFDQERQRPGLPEDVAAMVTGMSNEMTKVTLVNINQIEPREVIVQTGGYGEHQCLRVETGGKSFPVNNKFFKVRLARGAGAELIIYVRRFANQPTAAFPWHGDRVPLQ